MPKTKSDWTNFTLRIAIKAKKQKIYNTWATQSGLEKWFLSLAEFTKPNGKTRKRKVLVKKGDTYRWMWYGYPDLIQTGEVLNANDRDKLSFTFNDGMIVTVTIKKEDGENVVELVQEKIPLNNDPKTNLYVACMAGWTFYLANLKSVLEGGIDLRNKKGDLKNVVNA